MAQNAKLASLTHELIQSIVGFDPEANRRAYKHAKDIAARGLRAHQYNRTNQFEIQSSFNGLDEKFRVLDRDDLADALQDRVKEIQGIRNKWIPEYLALLLQLSDRPTENSQVEALELLRPPSPPQRLTWKEILEEDPYSDEEIWKDIDYAAESSEEEEQTPRRERKSKESPLSSIDEDDVFKPEFCVVPVDTGILSAIEKAQFWNVEPDEETGKVEIAELQAIRETLFMLAGLPTSLYVTDQQHSNIRVNHRYVLGHAIAGTVNHLLSELAGVGRDIYRLRQWTKRPSSLPLVQRFEAAVRRRLADYDKCLALLQRQYLVPETPIAVSLLELHSTVREISGPLLRLSQIVSDIEPELLVNPFAHLETLYQQITLAQMTLEKEIFSFFSELFFECLQTYLKPIRRWMSSGELSANDSTFFVFENDSGSEISSLWHDRFVLRRGKGDALRSPSFLEPAAMKIFNTGKSVVFLKELGIYSTLQDSSSERSSEPQLDHATVCGASSELPLSPFPELFQSAFETWIRSMYSLASTVLRTHLFDQCGLLRILNDFHILYLGANGSVFQDFADAIFARLDSGQRGWNDRFLLTELARGIYGGVLGNGVAEKIVVRSARVKEPDMGSMKALAGISMDYALPWPITNILQRSSLSTYHALSTLLLQIYRAKYLLQTTKLTTTSSLPLRSRTTFLLRTQLIHFVDTMRSYITETVIAPSFAEMISEMQKAQDIDEMVNVHTKFVARVGEMSLLEGRLRATLLKSVMGILEIASKFSEACGGRSGQTEKRRKRTRKSLIPAANQDFDSEDSDSDSGNDVQHEKRAASAPQSSPTASEHRNPGNEIKALNMDFQESIRFLIAGLRNIGRVGAEPVWEILAERLEGGNTAASRGGEEL